jgi:hypothetical protein
VPAVLQVFQPDQHVEVGALAAALGYVGVVEDIAADLGECVGLPLPGGAVVVAGQRRGWASTTVATASNIAAWSKRPFNFPPPPGSRVTSSSLTGATDRSSTPRRQTRA